MADKVLVYSTATCPHCIRLKQFLNENKIVFENYDVSTDPEKGMEMVKRSGQMGVPVIDIDGNLIVGLINKKYRKCLDCDEPDTGFNYYWSRACGDYCSSIRRPEEDGFCCPYQRCRRAGSVE